MTQRSDITDRLAANLRDARRAQGLSLDAVAKLSGVSRSMVSQIERGESSPTVATLWNLAVADIEGRIWRLVRLLLVRSRELLIA